LINFIIPKTKYYVDVLYTMINPIIDNLDTSDYIVSDISKDNCINIHFFNEIDYINQVGLLGRSVFISHGIADKNWRNLKSVDKFNYIVVSGYAWKDKMIKQGLNEDRIFVGGYPKLDYIVNKKKQSDKKIILWCPTHNMNPNSNFRVSSYPFLNWYLNKIPSEFEVAISEHPANKTSRKSTTDKLIEADVVIADTGSTLYESWILGKPVVFPDWIIKDSILKAYPNSFEYEIFSKKIGYHANNIEEMISLIYKAFKIGIDENTQSFIEGILPESLRGNSGKTIAEFLKNIEQKEIKINE
jgi:hypothetical protein